MSDAPIVLEAKAKAGDQEARDKLISQLPEDIHEVLSPILGKKSFFMRLWYEEGSTDYWIADDGKQLACWTVIGLTKEQATEARIILDEYRRDHPGMKLMRGFDR